MQVIITEDRDDAVIVTEHLEPNTTVYTLTQENKTIKFDEYQLLELIRVLRFINQRYDME